MPELPEVETLCRQLNAILQGQEIRRIDILDARLGIIEGLVGRRIEAVKRRNKFLQLLMDGGLVAELHLRMSGRLFWQEREGLSLPPSPNSLAGESLHGSEEIDNTTHGFAHSRLVIHFPTGRLILIDPRRFATFTVLPRASAPASAEDPLGGLSARRLQGIARMRRLPVKTFLMDQRLIAGIGNIYACEILFAAGVAPQRPSSDLSPAEWRKISKLATTILERAVACRGTTVSDWRDLFGCSGTNQHHLAVYARQGEPCLRCGGRIERITQGGRGTWFCPSCQK